MIESIVIPSLSFKCASRVNFFERFFVLNVWVESLSCIGAHEVSEVNGWAVLSLYCLFYSGFLLPSLLLGDVEKTSQIIILTTISKSIVMSQPSINPINIPWLVSLTQVNYPFRDEELQKVVHIIHCKLPPFDHALYFLPLTTVLVINLKYCQKHFQDLIFRDQFLRESDINKLRVACCFILELVLNLITIFTFPFWLKLIGINCSQIFSVIHSFLVCESKALDIFIICFYLKPKK